MGFLMGAYGKLMAGKLKRDLEFQLGLVTRRMHRVTKEVAEKTKMYEAQERNMKNTMQTQMQYTLFGYAQAKGLPVMNPGSGMAGVMQYGYGLAGMAGGLNLGAMGTEQWQQYSYMQQQVQMQYAQAQTMWQNTFEMQKEADLQALKDLEASLEIEKGNLESRLKIADAEYQYYKDEEKANAKSLVPEYTGQG